MADSGKFRQFLFSRINVGRTLRDSFDFVAGFIGYENSGNSGGNRIRHAINSLVHAILFKDGRISGSRRDICRRLYEERFGHSFAEERFLELVNTEPLPPEEAALCLQDIPAEKREQIIEFLLALAVASGDAPADSELIFSVAERAGTGKTFLESKYAQLQEEHRKHKLLVGSGWGVIAAIGVLLLFVITAKLLQSVIFGLIIGCVLLPLEKFIEDQLRRKSGLFYCVSAVLSFIFAPLRKLSSLITRTDSFRARDEAKVQEHRLIRNSVGITALTSVVLVTALFIGIFGFSRGYLRQWRKSLREQAVFSGHSSGYIVEVNRKLDAWKERFQALPLVRHSIESVSKMFNDSEFRGQLGSEFLKRSGGMLSVTADIFGAVTAFFVDLLLSLFFALLFLFKLAEFCRQDDSDKSKSEYVIRMIFNGIWLPGANEAIIAEARQIIEGVFFRLRIWLKGYLSLVLIDSTVYTTIFFFMGVPFFWLMGIIAGCGILLPYLGPVISCAITLLVTMAFGGASGASLLWIIVAYLIYNGIVEQFILYPAVIGEALGLSTLETIIVVLLGAIFAGITGMIFALPAASVAKFIIPQLYRNFLHSTGDRSGGTGEHV